MIFSSLKKLIFPLKLIIALSLLFFLIQQDILNLNLLKSMFSEPLVVVSIVLFIMFAILISVLRWYIVLSCQKILFSFTQAVQITFISMFFSVFLPGGNIGGDALRIAYATRVAQEKRTAIVWSIFFDRVIAIYGLFFLCFLPILLYPEHVLTNEALQVLAVVASVIVFGVPMSGFLLLKLGQNSFGQKILASSRSKRIRWIMHQLAEAVSSYLEAPGRMFIIFFLTLLIHILGVLIIAFIASTMGIGSLGIFEYAFAFLWSIGANALPISPGGLGVGEGVFDQIAHWIEPVKTTASYGSAFLVYRLFAALAVIPGAFFYIFFRHDAR
jgi:glycosyltransferase 2 family protein